MKNEKFNFTDVRLGFSCPYDMEKQIINESMSVAA
jgi:hypothetical protein